MKNVIITSASRTAVGSLNKTLKNVPGFELGSNVIVEAIKKSNLNTNEIDEVIFGQVLTGGAGQNPARQASIRSGIPKEKPAYIVNQVCGSGIRSVASGFQSVKSGDSKIVIAGGQESMSLAPHAIHLRDGKKLGDTELTDTMIKDGLWDAFHGYHMGITAENVAKKFNVSRENQDEFAFDSQMKTLNAIKNKKFENEIIKIENSNLIEDEYPKKDIKIEDLKKFDPVFKDGGSVTAGNSSGLNDGAAAVVLMKRSDAENRGLQPLAKIKCWSNTGVDPSIMGIGPISAINLATKKANWEIKDVDLFEINEAFAAQSIAVINELKLPRDKVNVNGGAIALGHPIGASGTRIVVTLLHEMIKRDSKKGVASLCVGGGMGIALCVERD